MLPGIEPRTPDLRVRCPTDCATRPGFTCFKNVIFIHVLFFLRCCFFVVAVVVIVVVGGGGGGRRRRRRHRRRRVDRF